MQTIKVVVIIGISVGILALASWLAYQYFLAPMIAKKKAETIREGMQMVGMAQGMVNQYSPSGKLNQLMEGMS